MAITYRNGATGTKTTTSGTTVTVTYSSAGNSQLFCVVAVAGNTTVSSVTDSAGNAWHLVGALNNGTGTRCELWKTDKVNASAVTSVTVTMSATGTRVAAAVEEYTNVAFVDPGVTGTGSTSPITTGATAVDESADFLFMGGSLAANNTFTAQNGNLRHQVGVTSGHVVSIDNTGAASLTDSATMTAASWAIVKADVKALAVTVDNNGPNWNDAFAKLLTGQINLTLSDDNSSNWNDSIKEGFGLQIPDVIGSGYGTAPFGTDPYGGQLYLQDSATVQLGGGAGALTEVLSDSMSMSDRLGIGYGSRVSDQIVLSDGTIVGYGAATSDQMTIVDVIKSGFGLIAADQDTSWADTPFGIGFGFTEQLVLSDKIGAGFGLGTSETLTFSDSTLASYGLIISDSINNWNETVSISVILFESLSDNLSNWLDSLIVGYGNIFNEQITIVDVVASTFGLITADSISNWSDTPFGLGFGFTEQLILVDATKLLFIFDVVVAETITLSDSVVSGYGLTVTEVITTSDSTLVGYGVTVSDNDNFWNDSFSFNAGQPGISLGLTDQLVMADSVAIGYGLGSAEQLTITDAAVAGYGITISDQLTLTDSFVIAAGRLLALSDSFPAFSDSLAIGYGLGPSEQLTITDGTRSTYGLIVSDNLNFWQDVFQYSGIGTPISINLSDQLSMSDGQLLVFNFLSSQSDVMAMIDLILPSMSFEIKTADQVTTWLDAANFLFEFRVAVGENLNLWNEFIQQLQLLNLAIQDSDNSWTDELIGNLSYLVNLSDDGSSNWKDLVFAGSMFSLVEVLADDAGANWLDQIVTAIGTGIGPVSVNSITVTTEVLANSITVTPEVSVAGITADPEVSVVGITVNLEVSAADITVDPEVSVETIEVIY